MDAWKIPSVIICLRVYIFFSPKFTICHAYNCLWETDFLAGGHGQRHTNIKGGLIYIHRVLRAINRCGCTFMINLEEDTCIKRRVRELPIGDIGGFSWPHFSHNFRKMIPYAAVTHSRPVFRHMYSLFPKY